MNDLTTFDDVPAYTAGNLPQTAIEAGAMQTKNKYFTAVRVQVPRDLKKIANNIIAEAQQAGTAFYYSWSAGGKLVEGPSIGLAKSLLREFGNCVVETEVETYPDHWLFKGWFIDLEKGYCVSKLFRQPKKTKLGYKSEKMQSDPDRLDTMNFQIGQSKAIRNVGLVGLPSWIVDQAFDAAKESVKKSSAEQAGKEAMTKCIDYFRALGVTTSQLCQYVGTPKLAYWTTDDIALLREAVSSVKQGMVSLDELFPPVEQSERTAPEIFKNAQEMKQKEEKLPEVAHKDRDFEGFRGERIESMKAGQTIFVNKKGTPTSLVDAGEEKEEKTAGKQYYNLDEEEKDWIIYRELYEAIQNPRTLQHLKGLETEKIPVKELIKTAQSFLRAEESAKKKNEKNEINPSTNGKLKL